MSEEETKVVLVTKSRTETKEASELAEAISSLTKSILAKAADGLTLEEIVSSLVENVQKVLVGAEGAGKMGAEAQAYPGAFVRAWTNEGTEILDAAVGYAKAKKAAEAGEASKEEESKDEEEGAPSADQPAGQ